MSFVRLANKLHSLGAHALDFNMPGSVLIIHNLPDASNDERNFNEIEIDDGPLENQAAQEQTIAHEGIARRPDDV